MKLLTKYYEANPNEGGGGSSGAPADAGNGANPPADKTVEIPEDVKKELEELRSYKAEHAKDSVVKTPEQLARDAEVERVNVRHYAVETEIAKDEDFSRHEQLAAKSDRDLVFEDWLPKWKEENPDIAETEMDAVAKSDFESEYRLSSENEKTKTRGLDKIKREAAAIRAPYEAKVAQAKDMYSTKKQVDTLFPKYETFIDQAIKESTPEKIVSKAKNGEEEVPVEIELTAEDHEEIAKTFKTEKTFRSFFNNHEKPAELKAAIAKKVQSFIRAKYFDTIVGKAFDAGKGVGTAQGSNAGANNPFPLAGEKKNEAAVISLEQSNSKIASARASRRG